MTKTTAPDTRVEPGVGTFEGKYFAYAKRDVRDDPDDLYEHRYDEVGSFDTEEEAQAAADKASAKMPKSKATSNAAYEEGGAGSRLKELRGDADPKRLPDTGEVR